MDPEETDVAGWPEFRKNNQMMQIVIRAYRDLPMHVIFVCPAGYNQDEKKVFHWTPALTGKLSNQVQGFVDIVGYLVPGQLKEEGKEAARRLFVQPITGTPTGKFDAKNRRASFKESWFDNPTMGEIMTKTGLLK
jgi:hypothetical protein